MSAPPRIGFLAPAKLTNGYTAAVRFAAHATGQADGIAGFEEVPLKSHADIIQAHADSAIDFGVIAVENTLDGIIIESIRELERLFEPPVRDARRTYVCWEELLPIRHLLVSQGGDLTQIRRICSHPSALRQCSRFLGEVARVFPAIDQVQSKSTGAAVEEAKGDPGIAAMASPEALAASADQLREIDLGTARAAGLAWDAAALTDYPDGLTRFGCSATARCRGGGNADHGEAARRQRRHRRHPRAPPPENVLLAQADRQGRRAARGARGIRQAPPRRRRHLPLPAAHHAFEYLFFAEIEGHCDRELIAEARRRSTTASGTAPSTSARASSSAPIRIPPSSSGTPPTSPGSGKKLSAWILSGGVTPYFPGIPCAPGYQAGSASGSWSKIASVSAGMWRLWAMMV
ncbi:MAG: prephenate dehydratase domain-containing protein [Verrucomicrobiales bacterium]